MSVSSKTKSYQIQRGYFSLFIFLHLLSDLRSLLLEVRPLTSWSPVQYYCCHLWVCLDYIALAILLILSLVLLWPYCWLYCFWSFRPYCSLYCFNRLYRWTYLCLEVFFAYGIIFTDLRVQAVQDVILFTQKSRICIQSSIKTHFRNSLGRLELCLYLLP